MKILMEENKVCTHGQLHECGSCHDVSCGECKKVWDYRNKKTIIPILIFVVAAVALAHMTGLVDVGALLQKIPVHPVA